MVSFFANLFRTISQSHSLLYIHRHGKFFVFIDTGTLQKYNNNVFINSRGTLMSSKVTSLWDLFFYCRFDSTAIFILGNRAIALII